MTTRTRAVHVPAAGYDVFGAMPCTPLCTLAPPFPYGLKAHCLRLSDITYSAGLPAFDEDSVSIQLRHSTMMHTTLDRTYRVVTQPGDALIIPRTLPAHFDNEVTGDSDILIVSLPLHLWQKIAALDLDGYGRPIELRPFAAEDHDPLLHGLGWALYQQMLQPANRNQLYLESLANTLALHLVQRYAIAKPRLRQEEKACHLPSCAAFATTLRLTWGGNSPCKIWQPWRSTAPIILRADLPPLPANRFTSMSLPGAWRRPRACWKPRI